MIKINENSVLKMREPSELLIISSRARKAKAAIGKLFCSNKKSDRIAIYNQIPKFLPFEICFL